MDVPVSYVIDVAADVVADVLDGMPVALYEKQMLEPRSGEAQGKSSTTAEHLDATHGISPSDAKVRRRDKDSQSHRLVLHRLEAYPYGGIKNNW
jgi:hypothetical protein